MLDWIEQNSSLISMFINAAMLLVWLFYAQLLFHSYHRQRRPRVLINKGIGGQDLDSPCLICNMSQEAIFLYFIMAKLTTSEGSHFSAVTDGEADSLGDKAKRSSWTRQGPLASGECLDVFSFRQILTRVAGEAGIELHDGVPVNSDIELKSLEFHVISIYGSDNAPFGAVRQFDIHYDQERNTVSLRPNSIDTHSETSRSYRRQIKRWLENEL
ncbi:hypothetical protein [Halopseudomonas salegens]|uniref:Uncharacterized protein n=1 Tax=Halopseudomonas salegens TaxID=1434072 RepID=A0A1H2HGA8_9GAMM|nr:hypothetical protein [Halopseudomonas salegens]SDU30802.1 hypothetical protein SAMN05216210_3017 [Halopseudomonas salegens]